MNISRRRERRLSGGLVALCALALLLLAAGLLFGPTLRSLTLAIVSPLIKAERSTLQFGADLFGGLRSNMVLTEKNRHLEEALTQSEIVVLDRNRLYEENLELKERLGRIADPNAITAAVLLAPPAMPYDTLLLDAGERDGVSVGDRVAAGGTVLIGEIQEVYGATSRAFLYSAPGAHQEGFLAVQGLAVATEGEGGGALRGRIPQGISVARGDELSLPSMSGGVLGFVEYVEQVEGESFQTVYFRFPVNPLTLRYVDIWRAQ